jgi:hypothetical protein
MPSPPEQHLINFPFIYENCIWGNNNEHTYKGSSGNGSKLNECIHYVCFIRGWLFGSRIQTVVDVGCGDLRHFYPLYFGTDVEYTGYDIYEPLINTHKKVPEYQDPKWSFEFKHCYSDRDTMKDADLMILKDVLQHWTDTEIVSFMDWATTCGKYKNIIITNCNGNPTGTLDTPGRWRGLNEEHFTLKKYNLKPIFSYSTKRVLLWCKGE